MDSSREEPSQIDHDALPITPTKIKYDRVKFFDNSYLDYADSVLAHPEPNTYEFVTTFYLGSDVGSRPDHGYFDKNAREELAELFQMMDYNVEILEVHKKQVTETSESDASKPEPDIATYRLILKKNDTTYEFVLGFDSQDDAITHLRWELEVQGESERTIKRAREAQTNSELILRSIKYPDTDGQLDDETVLLTHTEFCTDTTEVLVAYADIKADS